MLKVLLTTPNQLVYILSNGMANIANDYESERTESKVTVGYDKLKTPKTSIAHSCTSALGYITPISCQSSTWRAKIISTSSFSITRISWYHFQITLLCKGKAVPLQAWSFPEGSRNLKFPNFMTTAQYGGKVVSLTHRPPLPPGNTPGTYFC